MHLFLVTGGGTILLVRAADPSEAEKIGRKRMASDADARSQIRQVGVQRLDVEGSAEVLVKLVPREPAASE